VKEGDTSRSTVDGATDSATTALRAKEPLPDDAVGGASSTKAAMPSFARAARRYLVRLNTLAAKVAAPLTDAALTPYRAITRALPCLRPDYPTLVIGSARSDSSASDSASLSARDHRHRP
jgi:hypothetical protein